METVNQLDGCKLTTSGTWHVQADGQASIDWIRLLAAGCDWRGGERRSPVTEVKQVGIIRNAAQWWVTSTGDPISQHYQGMAAYFSLWWTG